MWSLKGRDGDKVYTEIDHSLKTNVQPAKKKSGKITRENVMSLSGIFPPFIMTSTVPVSNLSLLNFPSLQNQSCCPIDSCVISQSCQTQPGFIFGNRHKMIIVLLDHINKELACF